MEPFPYTYSVEQKLHFFIPQKIIKPKTADKSLEGSKLCYIFFCIVMSAKILQTFSVLGLSCYLFQFKVSFGDP